MTAVAAWRAVSASRTLTDFKHHMDTAKMAPDTIEARLEVCVRLARFLADTDLLDASPAQLAAFQQMFAHRAWATIDVYSRHVRAFYRWALDSERVAVDPTRRMVKVKRRKPVPHPIDGGDLRTLLACARAGLRMGYVLAAFAGLRCGEICRLRAEDLNLDAAQPTALIQGKGGKERIVPLLPPVVAELRSWPLPRRGVVVTRDDGSPWTPDLLTVASARYMRSLGIESTLHSLRHYFATEVVKLTRDVLLVRDLLGHESIATTQIYMQSTLDGVQDRLAGLSALATSLIANQAAT